MHRKQHGNERLFLGIFFNVDLPKWEDIFLITIYSWFSRLSTAGGSCTGLVPVGHTKE